MRNRILPLSKLNTGKPSGNCVGQVELMNKTILHKLNHILRRAAFPIPKPEMSPNRVKAAGLVNAILKPILNSTRSSIWDDENNSLGDLLIVMASEGTILGRTPCVTPLIAELAHSAAEVERMLGLGNNEHEVNANTDVSAKHLLRMMASDAMPILRRSTGADQDGESVKSYDGSRALESLNNWIWSICTDIVPVFLRISKKKCEDANKLSQHPIEMGGVRVGSTFSVRPDDPVTEIINRNYEDAIMRFVPQNQSANNDVWEAQVSASKNVNLPVLRPPPYTTADGCEESRELFMRLKRSPLSTLCDIYPNADVLDIMGNHFDVPNMLVTAASKISSLIAMGHHPLTVINYALVDAVNFTTWGVAVALELCSETTFSISDHGAIKVQRVGARPLSIQTALSRLLQEYHQQYPLIMSASAASMLRGDAVKRIISNFSAKITNVTPVAGTSRSSIAKDVMNAPPHTTLSSCLNMSYLIKLVAQYETLGSCVLGAIYMQHTEPGKKLVSVSHKASPLSVCMVEYNNQLAEARFEFSMLTHLSSGIKPLYEGLKVQAFKEIHNTAVFEGDKSVFTPAACVVMQSFPFYMYPITPLNTSSMGGCKAKTANEYLNAAANLLGFCATGKSYFSISDKHCQGAKPHGHDTITQCTCCDPSRIRDALGVPNVGDRIITSTNGSTQQGQNANMSSRHVLTCASIANNPVWMVVSGDDTAAAVTTETISDDMAEQIWIQGANLMRLGHTMAYTIGAACNIMSSKKSSLGFAQENGACSVVYNVMKTGTDEVSQTLGPLLATALGNLEEVSTAAAIKHLFVHISAAKHSENLPTIAVKGALDKIVSLLNRPEEETISHYSGSTRILTGSIESLHDELAAIIVDPKAPSMAKTLAKRNVLLLAKGRHVRKTDADTRFKRGEHTMRNAYTLQLLIEDRDQRGVATDEDRAIRSQLRAMLDYHSKGDGLPIHTFMAKALHLQPHLMDDVDYEDGQCVLVPPKGTYLNTEYVRLGSQAYKLPTQKVSCVSISSIPGLTDYNPPIVRNDSAIIASSKLYRPGVIELQVCKVADTVMVTPGPQLTRRMEYHMDTPDLGRGSTSNRLSFSMLATDNGLQSVSILSSPEYGANITCYSTGIRTYVPTGLTVEQTAALNAAVSWIGSRLKLDVLPFLDRGNNFQLSGGWPAAVTGPHDCFSSTTHGRLPFMYSPEVLHDVTIVTCRAGMSNDDGTDSQLGVEYCTVKTAKSIEEANASSSGKDHEDDRVPFVEACVSLKKCLPTYCITRVIPQTVGELVAHSSCTSASTDINMSGDWGPTTIMKTSDRVVIKTTSADLMIAWKISHLSLGARFSALSRMAKPKMPNPSGVMVLTNDAKLTDMKFGEIQATSWDSLYMAFYAMCLLDW